MTVAEYVLERLLAWDVRRIFGYPGDGINGLVSALRKVEDRLAFVQVRHEEMAAFMACAHAKFTGEVGVCLATSGPGATHLLTGLYDAKADHQPVVAIVGQQPRSALGGDYTQEVDLANVFKDVAHEYVHVMTVPEQARTLVDRAFRIARAERTVTCIVIPNDVQELPADEPKRKHGAVRTGCAYASPRVVPRDEDLRAAAEVLNAGERVAMLVGAGALRATKEVVEVADVLGAGVAKALLGKTAVSDHEPCVTGAIGLVGTRPSWDLMNECDTLLMVGSGFPYSEFLPEEGQARGVQIDIDPRMLGLRYPMELNLVGDSAETLRALLPFLVRKEDRSWRERIERNVREWWELVELRARQPADPVNPQLVFTELSRRLPDDAILCADSGSAAMWYARDVRVRPTMLGSLSGGLASMGSGVPYAIAAKLAYPERPVFALVGDGAMQMNGTAELLTVARYRREWSDPRLVVLVVHNNDLNFVTWELRALGGGPKLPETQDLPDFDYAAYADSIGLRGIRVERPDDVGPAWDTALASDRPVVIDARTDPEIPPLPPHISAEHARNFVLAVLRRDPHAGEMIRKSWRQMFPKGGGSPR